MLSVISLNRTSHVASFSDVFDEENVVQLSHVLCRYNVSAQTILPSLKDRSRMKRIGLPLQTPPLGAAALCQTSANKSIRPPMLFSCQYSIYNEYQVCQLKDSKLVNAQFRKTPSIRQRLDRARLKYETQSTNRILCHFFLSGPRHLALGRQLLWSSSSF